MQDIQTSFHGNLVSTKRTLYTPSSFAKTSLLYLQETGTLTATQPHTSTRADLSSYLFFLVESGSGTLKYDNETYTLHQGDCVFLDCRKGYSHNTSKDLWKLSWVHFYGPNLNSIYEKYTERGGKPCFATAKTEEYIALLEEIYAIATSEEYVKDMMLNEKLGSLLTLLMKESWNPELSRRIPEKKQNLLQIKEYLDAHYSEKLSLDEIAEQFYINKFYLTRIFKEQYGVSLGNYLLQVRITHAKQLLRFTDQPLETIAASCGMGDGAYFSRSFKKVEGMTPGQFRRQW